MRRELLLVAASALAFCLLLVPMASAAPEPNTEAENRPDAVKAEAEGAPSTATPSSSQLRLDEITIEGEVDVPRVLFIESRDRLRRAEFLHHLFLRDVTELGREAPLGHGISWTPHGPHEDQRGVVPSWTP